MSKHYHLLVWLDHHEARIFDFNATEAERTTIHSSHPHDHLHHKANAGDSGHVAVDKAFLERITHALAQAGAILIVGPGMAKKELVAHITRAHPDLASRISGVETIDHPTDGALIAFGRSFFKTDDRMHAQLPR
ncbi:MAG TPA: hypothetical protein VIY54_13335 [Steroidobacteraceae bacterium]